MLKMKVLNPEIKINPEVSHPRSDLDTFVAILSTTCVTGLLEISSAGKQL